MLDFFFENGMIRLRSWVQDALGVYVFLIIIKRKEKNWV